MTQNLYNITAIDWNIKEFKNNDGSVKKIINVYFELNDLIYFKGVLVPKRDGGFFIKLACSSFKNKEGVWKDLRHAGIIDREFSSKIEQTIINSYIKDKGKPSTYIAQGSTYETRKSTPRAKQQSEEDVF